MRVACGAQGCDAGDFTAEAAVAHPLKMLPAMLPHTRMLILTMWAEGFAATSCMTGALLKALTA